MVLGFCRQRITVHQPPHGTHAATGLLSARYRTVSCEGETCIAETQRSQELLIHALFILVLVRFCYIDFVIVIRVVDKDKGSSHRSWHG